MKKTIFVLATLAVTFLMVSTATAVPCSNKKAVEESDLISLVKEKIKEQNDDPNEGHPKCGALFAILWLIYLVVFKGWVPPWPY